MRLVLKINPKTHFQMQVTEEVISGAFKNKQDEEDGEK